LAFGRTRQNRYAQSGLHAKATISSGLGPEASTSTSHFFDPCRFHRLRRSLLFKLVMSSNRSLSGQRAVGSRRAIDGSRNEASKSMELCILWRVQTKKADVVTRVKVGDLHIKYHILVSCSGHHDHSGLKKTGPPLFSTRDSVDTLRCLHKARNFGCSSKVSRTHPTSTQQA
jgi:hypothetical protein